MDNVIAITDSATWEEVQTAAAQAWNEKLDRLGHVALPNPELTVSRGKDIYARRYQAEYERLHHGQFVAVDIESERAYLGSTLKEACLRGLRASLTACLFVTRVGFPAAFELKGRLRYACGQRLS